jgi:hypothetical protein
MVAFIHNVTTIGVEQLPSRVGQRFLRRLSAGCIVVLAAMLTFLWLGRIIQMTVTNKLPAGLAARSTLEAQVIDLWLVVPLQLTAGLLLRRHSPWGYLLAGVGVSQGLMVLIAIPTRISASPVDAGTLNLAEANCFVCTSPASLWRSGVA